jgi:phosphoglycolate phosphatase-like HAD superfamily hydrolase
LRRAKLIIYDCDGVLFDSKAANEAFYNHILSRFDMPPLQQRQLEFVHVSTAPQAVDYLFQSSPLREEAQAYREGMDLRPFIPLMRMEPNVREVLTRLRPGHRTAIATNRGVSMPFVMKDHELGGLFDLTVSSLDVREPKPHPECLLKILRHFTAEAGDALYVGDAEVDRLVAQRAGVPFVAYKNPGLEAVHHIQDHLELLEILEREATGRSRPA